jgi:DNA-binding NarL/FixJ family response regulator
VLEERRRTRAGAVSVPIRIAVLDAHPAIHAGLERLIAPEPDLQLIGCASAEAGLSALLRRTRPDIVVLDVRPGRLELCFYSDSSRPL